VWNLKSQLGLEILSGIPLARDPVLKLAEESEVQCGAEE